MLAALLHKAVVSPRYSLAEILQQIPGGAPIDEEWETMPEVGMEVEPAALHIQ